MDSKWNVGLSVGLALALLVAVLGLVMPVAPEAAVERSGYTTGVYKTDGGDKLVIQSGGEIEIQSGGALDLQSGATTGLDAALDLDSTLNVDGATTLNSTLDVDGIISCGTGACTVTDDLNVTGATTFGDAITLESVAFSGPVRFGSASVTSGTLVAHGIGTTPTVIVLTASGEVTVTPIVFTTNATSFTVGFPSYDTPGAMTVYWMAGK